MTNREWLFSLNDEQLSEFLTNVGLFVHSPIYGSVIISLRDISLRYIQSNKGIKQWLKEFQEFEVLEQ